MILHVLAPSPAGGLERVVCSLARAQVERGHRAEVAAIARDGQADEFIESARSAGLAVHVVRAGPRAYVAERRSVARLLDRLRPSVLHRHGVRIDILLTGLRAPQGRTVTTAHGRTGGDLKMRLYERVQDASFSWVDSVVAVSQPLAAQLVARGVSPHRVRCIPNAWAGAPQPFLDRTTARARLGIDDGRFVVGWVGRMSREKGADVFVAALERLADTPLAVSFIGDGPDRHLLEERSRALPHHVRWHGLLPSAAPLFPAFDALVLSSRTEGTPIVLFEAMAAGVPVIASRVGGVPDVVSDREATLVTPDDDAALASAIRLVRETPRLSAERAARARQHLEVHGVEAWVQRYETVYRGS
jgi:glycosyltransferase involved in cell wall biosynthesis